MQYYIEYTHPMGHESAATIQATKEELQAFVLKMEDGGAVVTKIIQE